MEKAPADAVPGTTPTPSPWWIECSETVGIDQVLALAAPSARHLVQLASGRLTLRLFRLAGPGFQVHGGASNLPLRSVGTTPADGSVTVTFVLDAPGRCTLHGQPVFAADAVLWPPDLEYDGIAPAGYRWATVILPEGVADTLGGGATGPLRSKGGALRVASLTPGTREEVARLLAAVGAWRRPAIVDLDPPACRELRARWHDLLERVFCRARPPAPAPRALATALRVVRDVESHWLARLGHAHRLREACEAARASERTVEAAFRRVLGLSPLRYLRLLRAHALFLELRRQDDAAPDTVQEAEARCGIAHPSRFAARYRAIFGELPSATLANARASRKR